MANGPNYVNMPGFRPIFSAGAGWHASGSHLPGLPVYVPSMNRQTPPYSYEKLQDLTLTDGSRI
jgi:hypothetical protein